MQPQFFSWVAEVESRINIFSGGELQKPLEVLVHLS